MTDQPGEALVAVSPDEAPSVLLTYDDGPDPEGTPAVLRELAAADARATFFVLGTRVQLYPDVFRSVVAEGHEIGLHGADHRRVDQVPEAEFSRVLVESKDMLEQAIQRPVVWYRPPYGRLTLSAWTAVHDAGMTIAGWTCDIQDWLDVPHEQHLAGLDDDHPSRRDRPGARCLRRRARPGRRRSGTGSRPGAAGSGSSRPDLLGRLHPADPLGSHGARHPGVAAVGRGGDVSGRPRPPG